MFIPPSATSDWENRPYDGPRTNPDYADFGEAFDRSFADTWFRERGTSEARNLDDAYAKQEEEIFKLTGEKIAQPLTGVMRDVENRADKEAYDNKINELNAEYGTSFKTIAAIRAGIAIEAHARRKKSESKTPIGAAFWGDLAGGSWAAMHDPAQIPGLFLGFGSGLGGAATTLMAAAKSVGKVAVGEAVSGAAVQAAIEPQVRAYHNKSLQMERSLADSAEAIALAGAGGAVIGGGLHGIGLGMRGIINRFKKEVGAPRTTAEADALKVAEARAKIEDSNPLPPEGLPAHVDAVQKASQDIAEGRPVKVDDIIRSEQEALGQAYDQVKAHPQGKSDDPLVAIKPEDIEASMVARGGFNGIGDIEVKGSGFGLVKFIWKHGEASTKPISEQITKSDILAFPEITRDFKFTDSGKSQREWVVSATDGRHIVYVDRQFNEDGLRRVVSIHVDTEKKKPLSPRKPASPGEVSALAGDTADSTLFRGDQRQAETTLPPESPKGKSLPLPSMLRPPKKKPFDLTYWVARMGGLKDEGGELAAMGVTRKAKGVPVGLLNNGKGRTFDDMAYLAWEAGYFPRHGENRPTVREFLDALKEDMAGNKHYAHDDLELVQEWRDHRDLLAEIDKAGIAPHGKSNEEISDLLRQHYAEEERLAAQSALDAVNALPENEVVAKARELLAKEEEFVVPSGGQDIGADMADVVNARELLAQADNNLDLLQALSICHSGGN